MKKDGKEFAMKELMSTSRQASKAAEKEANMLLFLGIYQNGSLEFQLEYCLQRRRNFETLNIVIFAPRNDRKLSQRHLECNKTFKQGVYD